MATFVELAKLVLKSDSHHSRRADFATSAALFCRAFPLRMCKAPDSAVAEIP